MSASFFAVRPEDEPPLLVAQRSRSGMRVSDASSSELVCYDVLDLLASAVASSSSSSSSPPPHDARVRRERVDAAANVWFAEAVHYTQPGTCPATLIEAGTRVVRAAHAYACHTAHTVSAALLLGDTFLQRRDMRALSEIVAFAERAAADCVGGNTQLMCTVFRSRYSLHYTLHQYEEAAAAARRASAIAERIAGAAHLLTLHVQADLCQALYRAARFGETMEVGARMMGVLARGRLGVGETCEVASAACNTARAHAALGRFGDVLALLARAHAAVAAVSGGAKRNEMLEVLMCASQQLLEAGRLVDAESCVVRALTLQAMGPMASVPPASMTVLLASILCKLGRSAAACAKLADVNARSRGFFTEWFTNMRAYLARLYRKRGKLDEADAVLREADDVCGAHGALDRVETSTVVLGMAEVERVRRQADRARKLYAQAIELASQAKVDTSGCVDASLVGYARLHRDVGEHDAAQQLLERALRTSETAFGPFRTRVGGLVRKIGKVRAAQGHADEARACADCGDVIAELVRAAVDKAVAAMPDGELRRLIVR